MNQILIYMEENPQIFMLVVAAIFLLNIGIFYICGRRSEALFRGLNFSNVKFREKGASGHSTKSMLTKFGGASKVLDIIVTDEELCIKGIMAPFTYIGTKYDLTHRVPLSCIESILMSGSKVEVVFNSSKGNHKLMLQVKDPEGLIRAVQG